MPELRSWREATQEALYGASGFYLSARPVAHFRTSVHTGSALFATAIAALLAQVDAALHHPDPIDLVDVGAGAGELLVSVAATVPATLAQRLRLVAVERGNRPHDLAAAVTWLPEIPKLTGLLVANEWLDNVPVDLVERDETLADRLVLVDPATGDESLGPPVTGPDATWLAAWWPLRDPGDRAELGLPREAAWAAATGQVLAGLAVAIDYGHLAGDRPALGTLTGYRAGRQVRPVPDGTCDITAHVAVDAVAPLAARCRQREVLRALGVTGTRPPHELASADPRRYLRALSAASAGAELTDPTGLGAFWWLFQPVGPECASLVSEVTTPAS